MRAAPAPGGERAEKAVRAAARNSGIERVGIFIAGPSVIGASRLAFRF